MAELDLKIQLSGELKTTLDELQDSLKEFHTQAATLEAAFREAMGEVQILEEQMDKRFDNLERRIEGLENSDSFQANILRDVRTDIDNLKERQDSICEALNTLDNKVYSLENK